MENITVSDQLQDTTILSLTCDKVRDIILLIFSERCVLCGRGYVCFHEIIPRSRRPETWCTLDNLVLLCENCHEIIHYKGSRNFREQLQRINGNQLDFFKFVQRENILYLVQIGEDFCVSVDKTYS